MSPIEKTTAMHDIGVSPHITDPLLLKRLNEQNIWEVLSTLPGEYTKQDILDYLKFRNNQLVDLVQDYKTMSVSAEPSEFGPEAILEMDPQKKLTDQDLQAFVEVLSEGIAELSPKVGAVKAAAPASAGAKFASVPSGGAKAGTEKAPAAPTGEEIISGGEETLQDATSFLEEFQLRLFDVQLQMALEGKNEELWTELQRIIGMVKNGQIDATFLLIALAKVNVERNGIIFSHFGKKVWRYNQMSTDVVNELIAKDPNIDPKYYANLQMTSQKQKEMGMQQQFLMNDMQKVSQSIEKWISFAQTSIDQVFKNRMEIRRNIGTR